MSNTDVIISALACGGKMSCRKQADEFKETPAVISINSSIGVSTGGGTVQGFRQAASALKSTSNGKKSILEPLFDRQKITPRRVALVSYLEGWSFINEVVKSDDFLRIDTIIVLEGLNTRSDSLLRQWEHWEDKKKLVLAYTQSPHKTASSKSGCSKLVTAFINEKEIDVPKYIKSPILENSISIYSKSEIPKTKIYHKDTLVKTWNSKSIMALEYEGKQSQDRTYIQQYVQPRLWRWLVDRWEDPTTGLAW